MFAKLLHKLGYLTKTEGLALRQKNQLLKYELEKVVSKERPVLDMTIGDPEPDGQTARKEYIARVAAFHKDVLEPKIRAMVSAVREELEKIENDREKDMILKGTCNALWLLDDWGSQCVNEMLSYQAGDPVGEELEIIKETLNK